MDWFQSDIRQIDLHTHTNTHIKFHLICGRYVDAMKSEWAKKA